MSRKLDEFVAKAAKHSAAKRKQHLSGVAQRLRKALLSSSLSDAEVQDKFGLSPSEAKRMLDSFRDAGANIAQHGGRWSIDRHMAPGESDWKMVGKAGKPYRFGLIADTHLGSKHCRLDAEASTGRAETSSTRCSKRPRISQDGATSCGQGWMRCGPGAIGPSRRRGPSASRGGQ